MFFKISPIILTIKKTSLPDWWELEESRNHNGFRGGWQSQDSLPK